MEKIEIKNESRRAFVKRAGRAAVVAPAAALLINAAQAQIVVVPYGLFEVPNDRIP